MYDDELKIMYCGSTIHYVKKRLFLKSECQEMWVYTKKFMGKKKNVILNYIDSKYKSNIKCLISIFKSVRSLKKYTLEMINYYTISKDVILVEYNYNIDDSISQGIKINDTVKIAKLIHSLKWIFNFFKDLNISTVNYLNCIYLTNSKNTWILTDIYSGERENKNILFEELFKKYFFVENNKIYWINNIIKKINVENNKIYIPTFQIDITKENKNALIPLYSLGFQDNFKDKDVVKWIKSLNLRIEKGIIPLSIEQMKCIYFIINSKYVYVVYSRKYKTSLTNLIKFKKILDIL